MNIPAMFIAAIGMAGLILLPHSKDATERMMKRGGAASVFGIGLFGVMFSLMTA